jgi:hypothetical protein
VNRSVAWKHEHRTIITNRQSNAKTTLQDMNTCSARPRPPPAGRGGEIHPRRDRCRGAAGHVPPISAANWYVAQSALGPEATAEQVRKARFAAHRIHRRIVRQQSKSVVPLRIGAVRPLECQLFLVLRDDRLPSRPENTGSGLF